MSKKYIDEFIKALDSEINSLKKGTHGNIVPIFNGKFKRKITNLYIYTFKLENFLSVIDDTPVELIINNKNYKGQIISVKGLEVDIAIEEKLGISIPKAIINTNLWFLLEILKDKFAENKIEQSRFKTSDKLFDFNFKNNNSNIEPNYTISDHVPNQSQKNAIFNSLNNKVSIIWGPPGTGKTNSISKAIEAHLNENRSILLVSHANTAVDEALVNVAKQLKHTHFYQEGKLIRLGVTAEKLSNNYPLVVLDKIAENLGKDLIQERKNIKTKIKLIDNQLDDLKLLIKTKNEISILSSEITELNNSIEKINNLIETNINEIQSNKEKLKLTEEKINKVNNYGKVRKFFSALDSEKLEKEKDNISIKISSLNRVNEELKNKLSITKNNKNIKTNELSRRKNNFKRLINKFNISFDQVTIKHKKLSDEKMKLNQRITKIKKELDNIQNKAISNSKLVATTLTKTFISKELEKKSFDVLIVDESSMAPLPYLYWAASMVNSHVTIVGDFNQLPPISQSKEEMAKKWLARNIYDVLDINSVDKALKKGKVSLLDIQYRMAPQIADISNRLFYNNILKNDPSIKNENYDDPLVFVDTSEINPWSSHLTSGSRFNIYSALVSASIVKYQIKNKNKSIGIITPYRPQARLINKILEDWKIDRKVRINTVHSFQGGEQDIIIFDTVESPGTSKWSLLDNTRKDSDADLLLNVALTRAKSKVFLVGYRDYISDVLTSRSSLVQIINDFISNGISLSSNQFLDNYISNDFDNYSTKIIENQAIIDEIAKSTIFSDFDFWPRFLKDLLKAKESIIIMSPFISKNRAGKLLDFFRTLISKNINVKIITRPPSNQPKPLIDHAEEVIKQLLNIGAEVQQIKKIHQKIAIIDNKITWEGSLNILSHNNTEEHMRRIEGENTAKEIIKNLEMDKTEVINTISYKKCPKCKTGNLVIRNGKYGKFYGCSRYPKCKYTQNIKKKIKRKKDYTFIYE